MNEQNALLVDRVSVTYRSRRGDVKALSEVALSVPPGQSAAILGPNGSGKTTLLKTLCAMIAPGQGRIAIDGDRPPHRARHLFGVVFQSDSLDPHMTVDENLRDQAALYGIASSEARKRIDEAIAQAGLADRRKSLVKSLSRGLARRVDLCRALLHRPRILLLDEPTVGLDPSARSSFLTMIEDRRLRERLTVVMSTHLIDEADRMERVILMHEGRIVADDAPDSLRRSIGARLITVFDSLPPADVARDEWKRTHNGWAIALREDGEHAAQLAAQLAAAGVSYSIAPPTLGDVFEHYTGRPLEVDDER